MATKLDLAMMARALRLAERGRYGTRPNPRVGCVIARGETILAEGWHREAGGPHAEVLAVQAAGGAIEDATVYVTLEPCAHHGRTPPCSEALVAAKPGRVVVGMRDPNPRVSGRGLAAIEAAGITVEEGVLADEAAALNPGFVKRMTTGRPRVILKTAVSLDGHPAMANGESKWITGEAARNDAQLLRAECGAVLTGSGTILKDNPSLNVRLDGEWMQPLRVVVDSKLATDPGSRTYQLDGETVVFTTQGNDPTRVAEHTKNSVGVISVSASQGHCDLEEVLSELAAREINDVLVEAGPGLAGAFLARKLVDEIIVYQAPLLLGDKAKPMFAGLGIEQLADRVELEIIETVRVGKDMKLRCKVSH